MSGCRGWKCPKAKTARRPPLIVIAEKQCLELLDADDMPGSIVLGEVALEVPHLFDVLLDLLLTIHVAY